MKLLRGKRWFELQLDKKGRKGLYVGPLYEDEKQGIKEIETFTISFMTRRIKIRYFKNKITKVWTIDVVAKWNSEGNTNQYISYLIREYEFDD